MNPESYKEMNTEVNNYDNQELNRNLPVLYTIPKWQLIIYYHSNKIRYFIPPSGKWANKATLTSLLSEVGLTKQEYYDRWVLNITVPSERPKCINPDCGKEAMFLNMADGYSTICSDNFLKISSRCYGYQDSLHQNSPEVAEKKRVALAITNAKPEVRARRSESAKVCSTEEKCKKLSESLRVAHSRPETKAKVKAYHNDPLVKLKKSYVQKEAQNRPEVKEKRRKSAKIAQNRPETKLLRRRKLEEAHADPNKFVRFKENGRRTPYGIKSNKVSKFTGEIIRFDSTYEERFYGYCSDDSSIVKFDRSNYRIRYYVDSYIEEEDIVEGFHTYHPDFSLVRDNGIEELVEIKPEFKMNYKSTILKREAAIEYCKENHIVYYTITQKFLDSHNEEDIYYHVREDDWI